MGDGTDSPASSPAGDVALRVSSIYRPRGAKWDRPQVARGSDMPTHTTGISLLPFPVSCLCSPLVLVSVTSLIGTCISTLTRWSTSGRAQAKTLPHGVAGTTLNERYWWGKLHPVQRGPGSKGSRNEVLRRARLGVHGTLYTICLTFL